MYKGSCLPRTPFKMSSSFFGASQSFEVQNRTSISPSPRLRFSELHAKWKGLRRHQQTNMDQRMTILPGVFPVGCKLETESESRTAAEDGLQAIDEALSKQAGVASFVPPSWVAARRVIKAAVACGGVAQHRAICRACPLVAILRCSRILAVIRTCFALSVVAHAGE